MTLSTKKQGCTIKEMSSLFKKKIELTSFIVRVKQSIPVDKHQGLVQHR
jgi:hypothetical protein